MKPGQNALELTSRCMQALYHGVTQIFIPLVYEQPWTADQIQWLGAGIHVPCKMPFRHKDIAPKLEQALLQAGGSNSMRQAAHRIGQLMRAHRWSAAEKAASKSAKLHTRQILQLECTWA